MSNAPNRGACLLLMTLLGTVMTATSLPAQESKVAALEKRLETLEKRVGATEDQDLPFDPYISEFAGRIQLDFTFNTDADGPLVSSLGRSGRLEDGSEFRRIFLAVDGEVSGAVDYKLQVDLAGEEVSIKDVYLRLNAGEVRPSITVGHVKEPFSLDEMTSSKYVTFLSRSMLSDAFAVTDEYNKGVLLQRHHPAARTSWGLGLFHPDERSRASPAATDGHYNLSGRLTAAPLRRGDGRRTLHLGLAYSHRQPPVDADADGQFDDVRLDFEPEVHQTNDFVDITVRDVDSMDVLGLEAAWVQGPFSLQGEWARRSFERTGLEEPGLTSYYLLGSYVLTGEHRPYDPADGAFGWLKPDRPWIGVSDGEAGIGAVELAARYSTLDFTAARGAANVDTGIEAGSFADDFAASAGEVDVITLGLNWYPHAHLRWMLNYVRAEHDFLGEARYVTTRFQVDF